MTETCSFVYNRAWRDTTEWLPKETKMFNAYIERFDIKIRDIFRITHHRSDSEEIRRKKDQMFKTVESKLQDIMEKRHYVSTIR